MDELWLWGQKLPGYNRIHPPGFKLMASGWFIKLKAPKILKGRPFWEEFWGEFPKANWGKDLLRGAVNPSKLGIIGDSLGIPQNLYPEIWGFFQRAPRGGLGPLEETSGVWGRRHI